MCSMAGHIYGPIAIWRNGHYGHNGHNGHNGHYGLTIYGHGYGQVGCLSKGMENRRSPVKELN